MLINNGDQKALYYNGIASKAPLVPSLRTPTALDRKITAASGRDIDRVVMLAYCDLLKLYKNGSKVSIFGFSRGAYAARILAGMLTLVGLPPPHNSALVGSIYRAYEQGSEVRLGCLTKPEVVFVGVWDTVESIFFARRPLPKTSFNEDIRIFRHALSVDERRVFYAPSLFGPPQLGTEQDIQERWFVGSHSDVGGRWVKDEPLDSAPNTPPNLSNIPLLWMVLECQSTCDNIKFRKDLPIDMDAFYKHHLKDEVHDTLCSRKGCWWWIIEVFSFNFGRARKDAKHIDYHPTVEQRRKLDPSYKPRVMKNAQQ